MSINGIGSIGSNGYTTSILGASRPGSDSQASAFQGRKDDDKDRIGALLGSGNINPPAPASNNF